MLTNAWFFPMHFLSPGFETQQLKSHVRCGSISGLIWGDCKVAAFWPSRSRIWWRLKVVPRGSVLFFALQRTWCPSSGPLKVFRFFPPEMNFFQDIFPDKDLKEVSSKDHDVTSRIKTDSQVGVSMSANTNQRPIGGSCHTNTTKGQELVLSTQCRTSMNKRANNQNRQRQKTRSFVEMFH